MNNFIFFLKYLLTPLIAIIAIFLANDQLLSIRRTRAAEFIFNLETIEDTIRECTIVDEECFPTEPLNSTRNKKLNKFYTQYISSTIILSEFYPVIPKDLRSAVIKRFVEALRYNSRQTKYTTPLIDFFENNRHDICLNISDDSKIILESLWSDYITGLQKLQSGQGDPEVIVEHNDYCHFFNLKNRRVLGNRLSDYK